MNITLPNYEILNFTLDCSVVGETVGREVCPQSSSFGLLKLLGAEAPPEKKGVIVMAADGLVKSMSLAMLFVKEQLKEPVALFWIVLSPVMTFYLINYASNSRVGVSNDYLANTSWFYAFVSSSVALFGLAFYMVGRRESGFLRSFVYTRRTKCIFLAGQCGAYSVMSLIYCSVFYISTRLYFGPMGWEEFGVVVGRFYVCFLLFSIPSMLLTLMPIGFQNTSTVFSVISFLMLALGIASVGSSHWVLNVLNLLNPMGWANQIMLVGVGQSFHIVMIVAGLFVVSFFITLRFLLINPIWSRY